MNKGILGIDLGTSSVKLLLRFDSGEIRKAKAVYEEKTPNGWLDAISNAFRELDVKEIKAIGLSSQVGTYIINGKDVISWDEGIGRAELDEIKGKYSAHKFIEEIAMPHPDIISYPIPRLMYIKKHYECVTSVCQPKDYLCKVLTGNLVTDQYSYRGLIHTRKGNYSDFFLKEIGIDKNILPKVIPYNQLAGVTTKECEKTVGIPGGIPVYTGLNDFFASVFGMDIENAGDMFDITGTSEHLGVLTEKPCEDTRMVSGVYFNDFIHYGVTASSGASLSFALREFEVKDMDIKACLKNNPPIFAPYLNGERAPIFDSDARGVFFGLGSNCTKQDMAYSVLEGVVFSLYHIYESMGKPDFESIKVSGGAAENTVLNILKAEMFGRDILVLSENDTSALGAVKVATKMLNPDASQFNSIKEVVSPTGEFKEILEKRYEIYKNLYPSLKERFREFSNMRKELI
ncbi:MAG: hypothetical protein E7415_01595 [Ruminococcaceae bacterium]|nr:hypothetical protein [Oscillospiraceae bacterium]